MRKTAFNRFIFYPLLIFQLFTGCEKPYNAVTGSSGTTLINTNPLPELQLFDVSYGNDPFQRMDIYLPRGRDILATPLLILVHGGQWLGSDKLEMTGYLNKLKERMPDWAFANINYRLVQSNSHKFPVQEQDVRSAFNFLSYHTDSFKISKKIAVLGESAGGQLALLVANKIGRPVIGVAIGIGVPSNVEDWYLYPPNSTIRPLLEYVTGGTPDQFPLIYENASVFHFISGQSPKTYLVHGRNDGVINYNQSIALAQKINSFGGSASLLILDNESHNLTSEGQNAAYNGIISFLNDRNLFK